MVRAGLLAWPTSCGGFGCAVAVNKREVSSGVDHDVELSIILLSRTFEYIITTKTYVSQDRPEGAHKPETETRPEQDRNKTEIKGLPHRNKSRAKHTLEGMFPAGWLTF